MSSFSRILNFSLVRQYPNAQIFAVFLNTLAHSISKNKYFIELKSNLGKQRFSAMEIFQKTRIPDEKIFLIMPRPKNAVCSGDFLYSVSTQTQIRENGDFRQSRKASDKYKKGVFPGRRRAGSRKTYPKTPRVALRRHAPNRKKRKAALPTKNST